jgi:hypothetical protein
MTFLGGSDLFWLYVVNIALGVVTFLCVGIVAVAVVREILPRLARQRATVDTHHYATPELGPMMADGGEPVKPQAAQDAAQKAAQK